MLTIKNSSEKPCRLFIEFTLFFLLFNVYAFKKLDELQTYLQKK